MKIEILQNKPGTAYSVSYNMAPFMQDRFGNGTEEEIFGTITLFGVSAKPGRTLPTGVQEIEYQDQIIEILASEDLAKMVMIYTFSMTQEVLDLGEPTAAIVHNPCDYLIAFNLAELCLTQLPSDAPVVNAAPAGADSSFSSSDAIALGADSNAETDSVAVGYSADAQKYGSVAVGADSYALGEFAISIGRWSYAGGNYSIAIGGGHDVHRTSATDWVDCSAAASEESSVALGINTKSYARNAVALGNDLTVYDQDVTVLGGRPSGYDKNTTRIYIMPEGSALANTYEDGRASIGYIVIDKDNTIIESGTRKLSELLTNNSSFAPAVMSLEDEAQPTVFTPTIEGNVQIERKTAAQPTDPTSAITDMFSKDKRNIADPQAVIKKLFGAFNLAEK